MRRRIAYAAILIFAFRAVPGVGAGYSWFTMDKLGFDEAFFGRLNEIGAVLGLAAAWFLSDAITRQPVARVLLWLTIGGTLLAIPNFMLVMGVHEWTDASMRLDARAIALLDAAAQSPLVQVSMIPLLTLIGDLRAARAARDLVRADGLVHEPGAGGRPAADQIPEPDLRREPWRLRASRWVCSPSSSPSASSCR